MPNSYSYGNFASVYLTTNNLYANYPITNLYDNYPIAQIFFNPNNILDLVYDGKFVGEVSLSFQNYKRVKATIIGADVRLFNRVHLERKPFMIVCRDVYEDYKKIICAIKNVWLIQCNYLYNYHDTERISAEFQYERIETNPRKICKRYLKKAAP